MPTLSARINQRVYYGWVIAGIFLIISTLLVGTRNSFGVFFKPLASEFQLNRATTSAIFSSYMVLSAVFAIFMGWFFDRYGPRITVLLMGVLTGLSLILTSLTNSTWQLFITYSFILALGTGATMTIAVASVKRWFNRKRGFALGITLSGTGMGPMLMAPFAAYLITSIGWRMSTVILGLIVSSVLILLSFLLTSEPSRIGALPDGVSSDNGGDGKTEAKNNLPPPGPTLSQALRTKNYWCFIGIWLFMSTCLYLLWAHIVPYATDIGIHTVQAATIVSIIGGFNIPSRILTGRVLDTIGGKMPGIIFAALQTIALLSLLWAKELWMLYLFAMIYGIGWGGLSTVIAVLITDNFGGPHLGLTMGTIQIAFALGAAIGPAMGGLIFDTTNSYFLAFIIASVIMSVNIIFMAGVRSEARKQDRNAFTP